MKVRAVIWTLVCAAGTVAVAVWVQSAYRMAEAVVPDSGSAMPTGELAAGARLFRRHCVACHGLGGGGDGRLAGEPDLVPRDFRRERFRYVSTDNGIPLKADLLRVIERGIPEAGMPPSLLLSPRQRDLLVDYVREIRRIGKAEELREWAAAEDEELDEREVRELADRAVQPGVRLPVPPRRPGPPNLVRGAALFGEFCASCHGAAGDGSGDLADELFTDMGLPIRPRDLAAGEFLGGPEDADLFWRIRCGLPGTPMASFSETAFSDEDLWSLVDFVRSLSRP